MSQEKSCTEERFLKDVQKHQLTVLRDDGVNRHLSFREPGDSSYWFHVITWPGVLCIDGDMGTYVFRRLEDMFQFFRTDQDYYNKTGRADRLAINPSYWSEKLQAPAPRDAMEYSPEKFKRSVTEAFDEWVKVNQPEDDFSTEAERENFIANKEALWSALQHEVLSFADDGDVCAYDAAREFECVEAPGFDLHDCWEWDCRVYKFHFLWCCYAITWAIKTYDGTKGGAA